MPQRASMQRSGRGKCFGQETAAIWRSTKIFPRLSDSVTSWLKRRGRQFLDAIANAITEKPCGSSQPEPHELNSSIAILRPKRIGRVAAQCLTRQEPSVARAIEFMKTRGAQRFFGLTLTGIWLLASAPGALCQGVVKSKHGDWELRCETPPGAAKEQCALLQSVAAEDKPNINLVVIVLKTADGKSYLLRVIAPLGVLLPSGLGLKIDDVDVGRAGFVRCLPTGCVAEVVMEAKLIDQMKSGQKATFIIFQTPEEGIGIPLTIAGFKEGFDALP
jgi:invasion protein IalB